MARWRNSLAALLVLTTVTACLHAQSPPAPIMFPPSAPPAYYTAPPGGYPPMGMPMGPAAGGAMMGPNGVRVPRGYPIPGADDPTELNRKAGSKNPLEMTLEGSNAFSNEEPCDCDAGYYAMIGVLGLARNGLGSSVVVVRDPNSTDQGNLPPAGSPPVLNTNDIPAQYNWGIQGAIGYRSDVHAVEIYAWKIFGSYSNATATDPGRLDLPFAASPVAFGLGIDNTLWLNADQVTISSQSTTYNIEGNYRYGCGTGAEWLCGIRYLDINDQYRIFTDDNGLVASPPDPRTMATYSTAANSRIFGLQIGTELENRPLEWVTLGVFTKLFGGANLYNTSVNLTRGDGYVSFDNNRNRVTASGVFELGAYADFLLLARARLRLGYQLLWAFNVPEAVSQVDYNLSNQTPSGKDAGEILYHGPSLQFHFAF